MNRSALRGVGRASFTLGTVCTASVYLYCPHFPTGVGRCGIEPSLRPLINTITHASCGLPDTRPRRLKDASYERKVALITEVFPTEFVMSGIRMPAMNRVSGGRHGNEHGGGVGGVVKAICK